jgi:ubiquinone/menaquinone biosynthesis C-methylase UbiE
LGTPDVTDPNGAPTNPGRTPGSPGDEALKARLVEEWKESVPWWLRWEAQFAPVMRPFTGAILRAADLRQDADVLDLACGLGEPAFSLAGAVPQGRVTAIDLTAGMLEEARSRARARRVMNVEFVEADLESLPFVADSFDRVTCRFGLVYALDPGGALRQVLRVLRPDGLIVLVVWGPLAQNDYWSVPLRALARRVAHLPADVTEPTEFVFSSAGRLTALLEEARFAEVREELLTPVVTWPGPPEDLVAMALDDYGEQLAALPAGERTAFVGEVRAEYGGRLVGGGWRLCSAVVVASARRPLP